jgi:hypothetical protein
MKTPSNEEVSTNFRTSDLIHTKAHKHECAFNTLFTSSLLKRSDLENFIQNITEICASLLSNIRRTVDLVQSFKLVAVDQLSEAGAPST